MKMAPDSTCNLDITQTVTTESGIGREMLVSTTMRLTSLSAAGIILAPRSVSQIEVSLHIAACSPIQQVHGCVTQSIYFHMSTRDSYITRLEKSVDSFWLL